MVDRLHNTRKGAWSYMNAETLGKWQYSQEGLKEERNPIALCEVGMLPFAMWHLKDDIRGRDVLWFVDNTPSRFSVIKDRSGSEVMDGSVAIFHIMCVFLQCRVWLEYVDSDSNWADGISRDLGKCKRAAQHSFTTTCRLLPIEIWEVPLAQVWEHLRRWSSVGVEAKVQ